MAHDELLARLEKLEADMCSMISFDGDKCEPVHTVYKALRAVVEVINKGFDFSESECCIRGFDSARDKVLQAIEKELK